MSHADASFGGADVQVLKTPNSATSTSATTHHQACTILLVSSMICVGSGIFMCESSKTEAKRGTTKFMQHQDRAEADAGQQGGIDHRGDDVAAQFVARPFELGEPFEDGGEAAAGFAGAHHVDVEVGEVFGMRAETVGERFAALQDAQNVGDDDRGSWYAR